MKMDSYAYMNWIDWIRSLPLVALGTILRPLALRPQVLFSLGRDNVVREPSHALEGERVAVSTEFPLVYAYPSGARWVLEPAPLARLKHVFYQRPQAGVWHQFAGTLRVEAGLALFDVRTGVRILLYPGKLPSPDEVTRRWGTCNDPQFDRGVSTLFAHTASTKGDT